jgi:hypothetical protein
MLPRTATVQSKTENAHGLMLSINEEKITIGRNHDPSFPLAKNAEVAGLNLSAMMVIRIAADIKNSVRLRFIFIILAS